MKEVKEKAKTETKVRRKFDDAFKRDAVSLWLSSGQSARAVAADLGVAERHIYEWRKTHGPVTPATPAERDGELAVLRRENALLRQRCDILKKTLGILSETPSSASSALTP
jgi:transposase